MKEIWKDIKDYEGLYQVSNLGRLRNSSKHIKILQKNRQGYLKTCFSKNGKAKNVTIHRMVAQSFIDNPLNKPQVNHINGVKTDNRVCNLEWATCRENIMHALANNLKMPSDKQKKATSEHNKLCYSKKVCQYDKLGNLIKTWESVATAQKKTNIGNISRCCLGKTKLAGGYKWEYPS